MTRGLIENNWDRGLFPMIEDGPEDRVAPFDWLNKQACGFHPGNSDYSAEGWRTGLQLHRSRGRAARRRAGQFRNTEGNVDAVRKSNSTRLWPGHISLDMFDRALKETDFH